jgi:hypothetical protein
MRIRISRFLWMECILIKRIKVVRPRGVFFLWLFFVDLYVVDLRSRCFAFRGACGEPPCCFAPEEVSHLKLQSTYQAVSEQYPLKLIVSQMPQKPLRTFQKVFRNLHMFQFFVRSWSGWQGIETDDFCTGISH